MSHPILAERVGQAPGSAFKYSGGGFTLLQLLVEEVTGSSFASFMKDSIFMPLGMERSSYTWDEASGMRLAEFFEADGQPAPHYRYTSLAATSLYTSLQDLERFFGCFSRDLTAKQSAVVSCARKRSA